MAEMDELLVQVSRSYSEDEMVWMVSHKRMDVQSCEKDAQMSAEDGGSFRTEVSAEEGAGIEHDHLKVFGKKFEDVLMAVVASEVVGEEVSDPL